MRHSHVRMLSALPDRGSAWTHRVTLPPAPPVLPGFLHRLTENTAGEGAGPGWEGGAWTGGRGLDRGGAWTGAGA